MRFKSKCAENSFKAFRKNANYAFLTSFEDPIQEVDEDAGELHHHENIYSDVKKNNATENELNFIPCRHSCAENHEISYGLDNNLGCSSSMPQQNEFNSGKKVCHCQQKSDDTRQRSIPECSTCKRDARKQHEKQREMFSKRSRRQELQRNNYGQSHRSTSDFTTDYIKLDQLPLHSKVTTEPSQIVASSFPSGNKKKYRLVSDRLSPAGATNNIKKITGDEHDRFPLLPAYWSPVYCIEKGRPKSALLMPLQHSSNQNLVVRLEIDDAIRNSNVSAVDRTNAMNPSESSLVSLPRTFRLKREYSDGHALSDENRTFSCSKSRSISGMPPPTSFDFRSCNVGEDICNQDVCGSKGFIRQNRINWQTKQALGYNQFGIENRLSINRDKTFGKPFGEEKGIFSSKRPSSSRTIPTSEKIFTKQIISKQDRPTHSQEHTFKCQSRKLHRSARRRIKKK